MLTVTEYRESVERLRAAAKAYYEADGEGILMSDAEYDELARSVAGFEEANGIAGSVLGQVAAGATTGDVPHSTPMLSLDNVFTRGELDAWTGRAAAAAGSGMFCVDPKLDGLAVAIRYEDGRPVRMVTRGDGLAGEDVSYALGTISNLPGRAEHVFRGHGPNPFTGEVRGEVIFSRAQFENANRLREAHGDKPFVNARNGAAGALRGANGRGYVVPLSFVAYDVVDPDTLLLGEDWPLDTYSKVMDRLFELGFRTAPSVLQLRAQGPLTAGQAAVEVAVIGGRRDTFPFEIDGAVIKIDDYQARARAGAGTRAPRWAVAYKYPPQETTSTLRAVHWQVGRTGVITPRAEIDPVRLAGSTITYATLHNPADVRRKGFMVGDRVLVRKAGDVVPRLEAPLPALRDGTQAVIGAPLVCPQCGGPIDRSQERWRCERGRDCGLVPAIVYAVSRDALDIDGLSAAIITRMVDAGLVSDVADLFVLTTGQVAGLPGEQTYAVNDTNVRAGRAGQPVPLGAKVAGKIIANIAATKAAPFGRVLCALGVRGTGRSASRALADKYGTMTALQAATADDVAETVVSVNKIGAGKAATIVAELAGLADVIGRLAAAGVNMGEQDQPVSAGAGAAGGRPGLLAGHVVCVTGTMVTRSRADILELVTALGGRAASGVSKSTTILVAGPKAGSKLTKAGQLGVPVMSEDEFLTEYGQGA